MQQAAAQLSIQVGYAAAEDGFGHAQITGGSSKASSIHHLGKLQHVVEIQRRLFSVCASNLVVNSSYAGSAAQYTRPAIMYRIFHLRGDGYHIDSALIVPVCHQSLDPFASGDIKPVALALDILLHEL